MFNKLFKMFIKVLLLTSSTFVFIPDNNALANLIGNFKVSKKSTKIRQRRTIGSGSRSTVSNENSKCVPSILENDGIELLVPNLSIAHKTSLSNPPLYLFSRVKQPISIVFTLTGQYPQPLVEKKVSIDKPGIVKLPVPGNVELKSNRTYLWYVAIPCQNNPHRYQSVLNSGIEKITLEHSVNAKLSNLSSNEEKTKEYSANGLWYETIDLILQELTNNEVSAFLAENKFFNFNHSEIEKSILPK